MKLTTFLHKFPSNRQCMLYFANIRLSNGIKCPHCGCTSHYFSKGKFPKFQCKNCGHQQSVKANTIMHKSKLSYKQWFIVFHLMTSTNNSFSAAEVQRQLGHKYYRPIWQAIHKIRIAMGRIEDKRVLSGDVEIDEAFFSTQMEIVELSPLNKHKQPRKQKKPFMFTKTKVVVMAESKPVEKKNKKYHLNRVCGNLKMVVVPDVKRKTLNDVVEHRVDKSSTVWSDGTSSHKDFPLIFKEYIGNVIPKEELCNILPYVHIAIGNSKAMIRNVHHCIKRSYLQSYLNEFVWKFNRRKGKRLFDTLVVDMSSIKNQLLLNHRKEKRVA